MTTSFRTYGFSSGGLSPPFPGALRNEPDRLNDFINVKDFGAVGDGVHDDTANVQAAIDYAYNLTGNMGGRVFFPRGTYSVTGLRMAAPTFAGAQALQLVGTGKRTSILKGSNGSGLLQDFTADAKVELIKNLTIWNTNTASGSLGIHFDGGGIDNRCRFDNLRIIAMNGVDCVANAFNVNWMNCDFICVASIGATPDILAIPPANSAAPGPVAGTLGMYVGQWAVYNCSATGFDVGFGITNAGGPMFVGNRAYRCNIGFYPGILRGGGTEDGNIHGCLAERCLIGLYARNTADSMIAGNVITGEINSSINTAVSPSSGPAEPAVIQGMNWNPTTHVVTVTTTLAHNLSGTQGLSLALSPPSWLSDGNTDGRIVPGCTPTGATSFTYAGPSTSPGTFVAGTWNYPMQKAMQFQTAVGLVVAANYIDAPVLLFSMDFNLSGFQYQSTVVKAMNGAFGWNWPDPSSGSGPSNILMVNVGANFPLIPSSSGFGGVEEVIASDGQPGIGFNGLFSGGGSTQYKIRRTGANFAVVG